MKRDFEQIIYEALGVKKLKDKLRSIRNALYSSTTKEMTDVEKKDFLYGATSKLVIGKDKSIENLQKFKNSTIFNTALWFVISCVYLPLVFTTFTKEPPHTQTIIFSLISITSIYSTMLQRYIWLKLNHTIRKMKPKYEKRKIIEKKEIEKTLDNQYAYKIVNTKNEKEKQVTIDEIVKNSSLEQLRRYRKDIERIYKLNSITNKEKEKENIIIPIDTNKRLKLERKEK